MQQMPGPLALEPPQAPQAPGRPATATRQHSAAGKDAAAMTVSIPLVVILGAAVYVAWRYMGLRAWQAVVCLLFGFFLAATTAAPAISQLVIAFVRLFTSSRP
jgi:hypothetical protein